MTAIGEDAKYHTFQINFVVVCNVKDTLTLLGTRSRNLGTFGFLKDNGKHAEIHISAGSTAQNKLSKNAP